MCVCWGVGVCLCFFLLTSSSVKEDGGKTAVVLSPDPNTTRIDIGILKHGIIPVPLPQQFSMWGIIMGRQPLQTTIFAGSPPIYIFIVFVIDSRCNQPPNRHTCIMLSKFILLTFVGQLELLEFILQRGEEVNFLDCKGRNIHTS